jgi:hypothetical protein
VGLVFHTTFALADFIKGPENPLSSKPKSRVDPPATNNTATNTARTDGAKSVGTPADSACHATIWISSVAYI